MNDEWELIINQDFHQPKVTLEEDEDLCLAQSYEFESMLSAHKLDDEEDLDCFISQQQLKT